MSEIKAVAFWYCILDQRHYSVSGPVSTGMGDCLQMIKSPWYVTSHSGNLA